MIINIIKKCADVLGLIISGSIFNILLPMITLYFQSCYFITVISSTQLLVLFLIALLISYRKNIMNIQSKKYIFLSGLIISISNICIIFSANPTRTPIILQSILLGLIVIPSAIFTKIFLKKKVHYNIKLIIPSIILLTAGILLPFINTEVKLGTSNLAWIILYTGGVIALSLTAVVNEKYYMTTDKTINNVVLLGTLSRLVQTLCLMSYFWVEYIIGYTDNPILAFKESILIFVSDGTASILFELLVLSCFVYYLLTLKINATSSNIMLLLTTIINPIMAIFYTIFSKLNPGIQYPIYIIIISLLCNVIGVILWIKGEKTISNENIKIDVKIDVKIDI